MMPLLWGDCPQAAVQMVCYGLSVFTVFMSYLFAMRGA